jgi:DNA-directed RNA polymerase specialized sigma24 family protein
MRDEAESARLPRRAEAMRHLPETYSLALRLRDAGLAADLIADCLGLERESLDPLLALAQAKLAAILDAQQNS